MKFSIAAVAPLWSEHDQLSVVPYDLCYTVMDDATWCQSMLHETKVIFACTDCGQTYQAIQRARDNTRGGRFDCPRCGAPVYIWASSYDYTDWTRWP